MNTNLIIAIVGILVVGAAGYFFMTDSSPDSSNEEIASEITTEASEETNTSNAGTGPLSVVMASGEAVSCTFSHSEASSSSEGTFRFANENYRVDAVSTVESGVYNTTVVFDGDRVYTWSSGPEGEFAMVMDEQSTESDEAASEFAATPKSQGFDVEQNVTYDCGPWSVDASIFVPPSDKDFMDMNEMQQNMMGQLPEGFEMPTSYPQSN